MLLKWRVVALALPAACLVACTDQPSAPTTAQIRAAPAADYMNNPGFVGPWIVRYENRWANAWYSRDSKVLAIHMTFPIEWVGLPWDEALCGPPAMPGTMRIQEISHWDPTHSDPLARYLVNAVTDSAWIVLLDVTTSGPCADPYTWIGGAIIASGWGRFHSTDNNARMSGAQETWTLHAEGNLTTADGDPVKYSGHLRIVYNPGSKPWYDYNSFINFH